MLNWCPWLSVRDLSRSPGAKLVLTALVLVQILAPNWIIWERNGVVPQAPAPGTAHGFRIASGAGRQAVICFYRANKPVAARETLLYGPKIGGRLAYFPTLLVQNLPGAGAGGPALFNLNLASPVPGMAVPGSPTLSPVRDHPGRAPPSAESSQFDT